MDVFLLDDENVSSYEGFIPEDIAENIGRASFRGLVAVRDDMPVGGMIWELINLNRDEDNEARIIWLNTADEEAGNELFSAYKENCLKDEIKRSSFSLPARTSKLEKGILKKEGFSVGLMEGDEIVAHLSEISALPFLAKIKESDDVVPLRSITQRGFNVAVRKFAREGYSGRCEDRESLSRSYFENDISCYCEQEDSINGIFLCHVKPSGRIVIELMAALGKNYQMIILKLIARAVKSAVEIYDPETEVIVDRHNYSALALGEKLFPRGFGIPVYIGNREE